jgi:hypothetical protein
VAPGRAAVPENEIGAQHELVYTHNYKNEHYKSFSAVVDTFLTEAQAAAGSSVSVRLGARLPSVLSHLHGRRLRSNAMASPRPASRWRAPSRTTLPG